jgi:hypothetical protein
VRPSRRCRAVGGAALLLLLGTGCSRTAEDEALQHAVDEARRRNAFAGAAVALLVTLALRHLIGWHSRWRARRRAARSGWGGPALVRGPVPPWLVAAAVTTETAASGLLLGTGAIVGWALGPVPGTDPFVENQLLHLLVLLLIVPTAAVLAGVAMLVQTVAARLPDVGVPTLVLLGAPHALIAGYAVSGAVREHTAGSLTGGGLVATFALVGVVGFWGEAVRRVRARRR